MEILEKTYRYPDTYFSSDQCVTKLNQPPKIHILNKLNPADRLQVYWERIQEYKSNDSILIVVPNRIQKETYEKFFSSNIS